VIRALAEVLGDVDVRVCRSHTSLTVELSSRLSWIEADWLKWLFLHQLVVISASRLKFRWILHAFVESWKSPQRFPKLNRGSWTSPSSSLAWQRNIRTASNVSGIVFGESLLAIQWRPWPSCRLLQNWGSCTLETAHQLYDCLRSANHQSIGTQFFVARNNCSNDNNNDILWVLEGNIALGNDDLLPWAAFLLPSRSEHLPSIAFPSKSRLIASCGPFETPVTLDKPSEFLPRDRSKCRNLKTFQKSCHVWLRNSIILTLDRRIPRFTLQMIDGTYENTMSQTFSNELSQILKAQYDQAFWTIFSEWPFNPHRTLWHEKSHQLNIQWQKPHLQSNHTHHIQIDE
jgi:hypothetical protein